VYNYQFVITTYLKKEKAFSKYTSDAGENQTRKPKKPKLDVRLPILFVMLSV